MINDFRSRGQSIDLRDRQSLAKHAKAYFPSDVDVMAGLKMLRAYHEPDHVAGSAGPSADDVLIAQLTKPERLPQHAFTVYQRHLRKFSEALKNKGQTISELNHHSREEFARKLFPKNVLLNAALGNFRDQLDAKQVSGAGGLRESGGRRVPSPRLDGIPAELWDLFGDEAEEPPTDPLELQRLEHELRMEIQGRPDGQPAQPPFSVEPEGFTVNPEELLAAQVRRLLDDQAAQSLVSVNPKGFNAGASVLKQPPLHELGASKWGGQHIIQGSGHEYSAALGRSSVLASQNKGPTSLVIDTDRYTALLVPAGLESKPQELRNHANFARTPSDAQIGMLGRADSPHDRSGRMLRAMQWLGDEHIQRDYELLAQELRVNDPNLAVRTQFVDPLIAFQLSWATDSDALRALQRIVYDQNGNDVVDFLFLPVNDASPTDPKRRGTHWSLLFVDRSTGGKTVAYHYDSAEGHNHGRAERLAERLGLTLQPAGMAPQQNQDDCGVFVVDGTRELVRRLAHGERPQQHEPLHLDNLVTNRQALRERLRG